MSVSLIMKVINELSELYDMRQKHIHDSSKLKLINEMSDVYGNVKT